MSYKTSENQTVSHATLVFQRMDWDPYGKARSVESRSYALESLDASYTSAFGAYSGSGRLALGLLLENGGFPDSPLREASLLEFTYDALGHRIGKRHYRREEPGLAPFSFGGFDRNTYTEDLYARDATGNAMAIYKKKVNHESSGEVRLSLSEQPIYGGARVGVYAPDLELLRAPLSGADPYGLRYDAAVFRPVKAGVQRHWVNPEGAGRDGDCSCELARTDFLDARYGRSSTGVRFSGRGGNNVSVAESPEGDLLFYAQAPESYMGKNGTMLVYASDGRLMKGGENLRGSSSDKSAVMASPSEPGVHYLFGTDGDGRLLLHTIDLKEPGYGSAPGVVREGNVPIGGDYRYGRHKVVIEDPRHGYQLLTTRYVEEGAYTELVYFEVTEDGVQPAVALDTIHGHDRYGDGELQLDESASQLAYYNRAKYLGGFGYQQVELNLLSLSENRRAVTGKIKVPGAAYGTSGKNSVEYYHVDGEAYLFFNQEGLFRSETDGGYRKVLRLDPDGALREVDTEHFGDLRRGLDGRLYLASADAGGQIQYYDLSSDRFYPGDQETPATVSAPGSISYLPTQVFRQPEELESWHGRHVGAKRYELTDHLGNVHAVLSDRRIWKGAEAVPEVYAMTDYYPFGSERNKSNSKEYRWNFQNQEKDSETGLIVYKYRMYDPETGRFKSTDPLEPEYPWNSSYAFSENRVIDGIELEGLEYVSVNDAGINPDEHISGQDANGNNQYSFSLGNQQFSNVVMVNYNGGQYFNLGQHMYYGDNGWSNVGTEANQMTEWVYTDIQNFDVNTMHTYTWEDPTLTGNNTFGSPKNTNCADLACTQASAVGTNLQGGVVSYSNAVRAYNAKTSTVLQNGDAIDYINRQLEAGNAVVIGVHYGTGSTDALGTDHYVTITGRTSVNGEGRFLFIENAIGNKANARDFNSNRLTPSSTGITGSSPHWYNTQYRVTRVQKNQ